MSPRSVLVLGAGMVGVSCALALQKRGFAVTLVDRREPGRETSYGNAGVLSRSSIVPLNNPALFRSLPAYLGNRSAALHIDWRRLIGEPGWMLRFLWEARPGVAAERMAALDSLTRHTLPLHRALMQEAGIGHRLRENGTLKLWRSPQGLAKAQAEQAMLARHGIETELLDRQALSGLEPSLRPIFPAGLLFPGNGSVDSPGAVVAAYAALFGSRGGTVRQAGVSGVRRGGAGWLVATDQGDIAAEQVVVALGPWSADLLRPLGLRPPLGVERGYHRHLQPHDGAALRRPLYDVEAAYFMAPMEQGIRISSGVELAHRDAPDNHRQIEAVVASAREALPLAEGAGEIWRGARPTLPDSLPMIGEAPRHPGLWLAFGNQHIGFSTGPVTGEILAALMAGEAPPADPAPFRPGRYLA